ncbi:MAG: sigma-70 family RNA polymerase sigma factor [Verrucomicrobia bacterium]|nr:sigma-70 family RNA polymerase sigma factor [Verrucomicrobiota bacterium]
MSQQHTPDEQFPPTMWSAIVSAREGGGSAAQKSLERLARAYWQPLYLFVRRSGHGHEEARDLTQGFFAHLLSRDFLKNLRPEAGRFRGFLVRSLQRWLMDQYDRRTAAKRGGGEQPISLEALGDGLGAPTTTAESPERAFDRQWAREIVARALAALERSWADRAALFQALKPSLDPHSAATLPPYAEIAARLGTTEQAVKSAAFRLRQEYVAAVRSEVRSTVADPAEVDDEIRHLVSLLRE